MKRKHSDKVSSFKRRECSSNDTNSSDLDEEKYKRKRKKREKKSSSSDSGDSSDERRKKRKRTKRKRKKEKKKKRERPEIRESERCFDVPVSLMNPNKEMAPMTKEEWEKRQSVVKRVFDEPSGRYRLIKGDGEVIEEIVSRDRHQEINRQATKGDGAYFQTQLSTNLKK